MTQGLDVRRKRLRFRAWHRGTKEADLILGRFADRYLDAFDEDELVEFEALLDRPDPEIFDWVAGRSQPDTAGRVTRLLLSFDTLP